MGERVLEIYRAVERDAEPAVAKRLPQLLSLIRPDASNESQSMPKEDTVGAPNEGATEDA